MSALEHAAWWPLAASVGLFMLAALWTLGVMADSALHLFRSGPDEVGELLRKRSPLMRSLAALCGVLALAAVFAALAYNLTGGGVMHATVLVGGMVLLTLCGAMAITGWVDGDDRSVIGWLAACVAVAVGTVGLLVLLYELGV